MLVLTNINKPLKAPQQLISTKEKQGSLQQNGISVISFCLHTQGKKGSYFLKDHLLLFIKSGTYTVRFNHREYTVRSNEMVFLHKSILIDYDKSGEAHSEYKLDYIMFFLSEELLAEFTQLAQIKTVHTTNDIVPVMVLPIHHLTRTYFDSLEPYFDNSDQVTDGLVKVKLMELLFHLIESNEQFVYQLLQPNRSEHNHIQKIMEENYTKPVSLQDLAYLSGKSLSTFKREFQTIYQTSPLKWIRNRRLDHAEHLLCHTTLSVTDICYSIGFENLAHFSKVFKLRFGLAPSEFRYQFNSRDNHSIK